MRWVVIVCLTSVCFAEEKRPQYESGEIRIPVPEATERVRATFSSKLALEFVERGAVAWSRKRGCVSCHTTGAYLQLRPALTPLAGPPSREVRASFVRQLESFEKLADDKKRERFTPTQIAYVAAGLTAWDRHVAKKVSPEATRALEAMLEAQSDDGSWGNVECWPPLESSAYHGTTVAAMALANRPDYLASAEGGVRAKIDKLHRYLRETKPPHDYARVLLLWAASRVPGLLEEDARRKIIDRVFALQRPDGGWSLRTFAAPEAWGDGSRAKRIRSQPEFENLASDGHQTGLCVLALRSAGVPATDPRLARACRWLLSQQRESGRWWTRSLNTDRFHYVTYTGTLYPLLALHACGELDRGDPATSESGR